MQRVRTVRNIPNIPVSFRAETGMKAERTGFEGTDRQRDNGSDRTRLTDRMKAAR